MNNKQSKTKCSVCGSISVEFERILNNHELLKCKDCTFVFTSGENQEITDTNLDLYDEKAAIRYKDRDSFIFDQWYRNVVKRLSKKGTDKKVLDIGCGHGTLLKFFKEQGWSASGSDLCAWAQKPADLFGYTLHQGPIEEAGLPENSFDLVTSTNVLEHITDPIPHVQEIIRLLKHDGTAYFNIPNYGSFSIRMGFSQFFRNMPPNHTGYYTKKSVKSLFSHPSIKENVKKIKIRGYGIPELHRIISIIKKKKSKPEALENKISKSSVKTKPQDKKTDSLLKTIIGFIIIKIYYFSGIPFSFGDKLEVIVIKK